LDLDHLLKEVDLPAAAEDCAIHPITAAQSLMTNIDIVTPIHDDPFTMGQIAAVNVTNDLFAMNAVNVVNYSCFLALPTDLPDGFAAEMLKGTRAVLRDFGSDIHGGHTIQNTWPLLGGTASAVVDTQKIIYKRGAHPGDRLIITKPLGIHPTMAADRAWKDDPEWLAEFSHDRIEKAIQLATKIMTTSNRPISQTIHEYNFFDAVHAMTDITGFGFTAHVGEMVLDQEVGARITELPVISYALELDDLFCYRLREGKSAEIAGPMVLAIDPNQFSDFVSALDAKNIWWMEIGVIESQLAGVKIEDKVVFREVEEY